MYFSVFSVLMMMLLSLWRNKDIYYNGDVYFPMKADKQDRQKSDRLNYQCEKTTWLKLYWREKVGVGEPESIYGKKCSMRIWSIFALLYFRDGTLLKCYRPRFKWHSAIAMSRHNTEHQ